MGRRAWLYCLGTDIFTRGESELIGGSYGGRDTQSRQLNEYAELDAENPCVKDHYADLYYSIQACNTALADDKRSKRNFRNRNSSIKCRSKIPSCLLLFSFS